MSTAGKDNPEKQETGIIIPDEIRKALEKVHIPEKQRKEIAVTIASYFRGPLPPPSVLREYDDIVSNGAERIFQGYESQREHRQGLERLAVGEQLSQSRRGQLFGFILAIVGLGLSGFMAYLDHEIYATAIGTSTVIGLVTIFVLGKRAQQKDLESKK